MRHSGISIVTSFEYFIDYICDYSTAYLSSLMSLTSAIKLWHICIVLYFVSHMTKQVLHDICYQCQINYVSQWERQPCCWYIPFVMQFFNVLTQNCAINLCSINCTVNRYDCVYEKRFKSRVVSSEISGRKFLQFPDIYSNLSGNSLITYVYQLFPSPALQSDAIK